LFFTGEIIAKDQVGPIMDESGNLGTKRKPRNNIEMMD